jgi:Meiotically up-regulated gene 113
MANKLAGQRAKFSRAHAIYYSTSNDAERERAVRLMAEVVRDATGNGFDEEDVTQSAEIPGAVREALHELTPAAVDNGSDEASDEEQVALLRQLVDLSGLVETGRGSEVVYAYGYACAPDRLKIGMTTGDPVARVATQIGISTPDCPSLRLLIRTPRARVLERAIHSILDLQDRRIRGGGAEWFRVTADEVLGLTHELERLGTIAPGGIGSADAERKGYSAPSTPGTPAAVGGTADR